MKKYKKITLICALILIIFFVGLSIFYHKVKKNSLISLPLPPNSTQISKTVIEKVPDIKNTSTVSNANEVIYEDKIEGETSVYNFMSTLRNEGRANFVEKNYIGMGELIVEINGIKNTGSKNWIYYVDGKEASVGVSNYKINAGDTVTWKYEKYF